MNARFKMVKERHGKTLEIAITDKKADTLSVPLCEFIRDTQYYFTSSSCSGRIVLIQSDRGKTKQEGSFFGKWHSVVSFDAVWELINTTIEREELWFKQQPFILHIGTDTIEHANSIIAIMRECGMKRGGIMLVEEGKVMIEIVGTHNLSLPIKRNNELLVSKEYVQLIVENANEKMRENQKRLELFEQLCREKLQ
jgi:tRNA wybutosine-synthesizing protein 3